jgi:invasion protein IalB
LQAGCIVELEFGAESLEKLKSARELNVNFYIAENDQKQTFDISLDGFEQAFEQIASSEGK